VSRIRKKTFYLQFYMGTPKGHQKSEKKTNILYGIYPTKFAGSTQSHKKIIETKDFSKKICLVP
jgi:hypothetical protein